MDNLLINLLKFKEIKYCTYDNMDDLEGIMLSEISQTEKDKELSYDFTHVWNIKKVMNQLNKTQTNSWTQAT